MDQLDEKGIDPYRDVLTEARFRELFGSRKHTFTGVDYITYYRELIEQTGCEAEVILANDCKAILAHTDQVVCCDIHTRHRTKRILKAAGAVQALGLDELLTESVDGSGFNPDFGLLGSNKATEET